jgi:hypothetical protein
MTDAAFYIVCVIGFFTFSVGILIGETLQKLQKEKTSKAKIKKPAEPEPKAEPKPTPAESYRDAGYIPKPTKMSPSVEALLQNEKQKKDVIFKKIEIGPYKTKVTITKTGKEYYSEMSSPSGRNMVFVTDWVDNDGNYISHEDFGIIRSFARAPKRWMENNK